MNPVVYHIVSGQAYFSGCLLIIAAVAVSGSSRGVMRRLSVLLLLTGVIAVVVSSTAISYWLAAAALGVTLLWVCTAADSRRRKWSAGFVVAVWFAAMLIEFPYHMTPEIPQVDDRAVTVLGDSVSAGIGGDEKSETWPRLLAQQRNLRVQDLSHVGETAGSALKRVKTSGVTARVVIVEVGGNNLLGPTSAEQFARDLDALLLSLTQDPKRNVVMFELPLPPFCHEYGRTQRVLAKRYNVLLIPKRIFLSVLADEQSTIDSIHLTQAGHQRMADTVWKMIRPAFDGDR